MKDYWPQRMAYERSDIVGRAGPANSTSSRCQENRFYLDLPVEYAWYIPMDRVAKQELLCCYRLRRLKESSMPWCICDVWYAQTVGLSTSEELFCSWSVDPSVEMMCDVRHASPTSGQAGTMYSGPGPDNPPWGQTMLERWLDPPL